MKTKIFFLLFVSCWISSFSQYPVILNPKPFGNTVNDFAFFDDNYGLLAGDYGAMAYTATAGNHWQALESGVTDNLKQISIAGTEIAYIMADTVLIKTLNKGLNWQLVFNLRSGLYFISFQMVNDQVGFALCGVNGFPEQFILLRTTNGWSDSEEINLPFSPVSDLAFSNASEGILVADEALYRTSDGGNIFEKVADYSDAKHLTNITYAGSLTYYAVGYYYTVKQSMVTRVTAVVKSVDNGITWQSIGLAYNLGACTYAKCIKAANADSVVLTVEEIGCEEGRIWPVFVSLNGGLDWSNPGIEPNVLTDYHERGVQAVGITPSGKIWVYESKAMNCKAYSDNFNTFFFNDEIVSGIEDVTFNSGSGYLLSNRLIAPIQRSSDGGKTWDTLQTPVLESANRLYKLAFADALNGIASGLKVSLSTNDGGDSWTLYEHLATGINFISELKLSFPSFGKAYRLLKESYTPYSYLQASEDQGQSWQDLSIPNVAIHDMSFVSSDTGFLFSGDSLSMIGGLYQTSDAGFSWHFLPLVPSFINHGQMLSWNLGFVASESQTVYRVVNQNGNFSSEAIFTPSSGFISDIGFTDYQTGYVLVNDNGKSWVFATLNGGSEWVSYGPFPELTGLEVFYGMNGFAYGSNSQFIQLGQGYPVGIPGKVVPQVSEPQIYPNPCTDEILIEIAESTPINGCIFDANGRVVQRYTNDSFSFQGGTLKINTTFFRPGLYFYHISSGSHN
jgi:photosystem II stability/assembly factor-like uncharacterized protein